MIFFSTRPSRCSHAATIQQTIANFREHAQLARTAEADLQGVVASGLIVAGPQAADWLAARLGFGPAFALTWKIAQWPIAFALVVTGIGLVYYFAPDAEQDWAWITPGAVLATVLWLIGSIAFRFYVVNFGNYEATYGAITGVILLMLWFYLSGLVLLAGAEASAEIEHASPWGKAPGEKIPGQKKKIGSAAGRAWRERGRVLPLRQASQR